MMNMMRCMAEMVGRVLFPPRCVLCDELLEPGQRWLHPSCRTQLYEVENPVCLRCGRPVISESVEYCFDCARKAEKEKSFRQGKALFIYKGEIKKSMYRFKYGNRREYAGYFARQAFCKYGEWIKRIQPDAVVPVPMYRKKKRKRGYNQAEVFAKALAAYGHLTVRSDLVLRIKDTTPQKLLNDAERKNNLKNAFQTTENIVKYKRILLVDDIYTTGSTADAVTECLYKAGATDVYFMSICIGKGQ